MASKITRVISVSTPIAAAPSTVFALIIDLPGYNTWLPSSSAFKGTTSISETPIQVGTTYVEQGPAGTRYGKVVALDNEARHVRFAQPMGLKPEFLGIQFDIAVDMKVNNGEEDGSVVEREVTLVFPWIMGLAVGYITKQFDTEIRRTMAIMKGHLESRE